MTTVTYLLWTLDVPLQLMFLFPTHERTALLQRRQLKFSGLLTDLQLPGRWCRRLRGARTVEIQRNREQTLYLHNKSKNMVQIFNQIYAEKSV